MSVTETSAVDRRAKRDRARRMRNNPTDAEYRLWYFLRAQQLAGVKFRRQAPIGRYIVDFVAFHRKLIIELDGGQHGLRREYDEQRTRWFASQGFRVLRFWNHDVLEGYGSGGGGDLARAQAIARDGC